MSNRYSPDSRRQRILAYVRDNPACMTRDIADEFGMDSRRVGSELDQLCKWGYATRMKIGRFMHWRATDRAPHNPARGEVPHRPTVTEWTPGGAARCPLVAALFGVPA